MSNGGFNARGDIGCRGSLVVSENAPGGGKSLRRVNGHCIGVGACESVSFGLELYVLTDIISIVLTSHIHSNADTLVFSTHFEVKNDHPIE